MVVRNIQIDAARYGRLCAKALPMVITNDEEFHRMAEQLEALSFKKDITLEESRLAELLTKLVGDYDATHYPIPGTEPHEMITFLMEQRGLKQIDLLPIFGSRGIASEVLRGRREPSKTHIRKLADYFHVSPELFL